MSDPNSLKTKWNVRHQYSVDEGQSAPAAAAVLTNHLDCLPNGGVALDLAAGRGGNAALLDSMGFKTSAWDISEVAMTELKARCPGIETDVRDVCAAPPSPEQFDVITVSRFLERDLCESIANALKLKGVLFYQTFHRGLSNPDFLLKPNELLSLFSSLSVLHYSEKSDSDEAMLIAKRVA